MCPNNIHQTKALCNFQYVVKLQHMLCVSFAKPDQIARDVIKITLPNTKLYNLILFSCEGSSYSTIDKVCYSYGLL